MKSIDMKSLIIGILGTVLLMVLMGQSGMQNSYDIECVYLPSLPKHSCEECNEGTKENHYVGCRRFLLNEIMPFAPSKDLLESRLFLVDNSYEGR